MRLLILNLLTFCAACTPEVRTEYVFVTVEVPDETLAPCPLSDRTPDTFRAAIVRGVEDRAAAECANGKLATISTILDQAQTAGPV